MASFGISHIPSADLRILIHIHFARLRFLKLPFHLINTLLWGLRGMSLIGLLLILQRMCRPIRFSRTAHHLSVGQWVSGTPITHSIRRTPRRAHIISQLTQLMATVPSFKIEVDVIVSDPISAPHCNPYPVLPRPGT